MKKNIIVGTLIALFFLNAFSRSTSAADFRGLILINVSSNGEAWYVNPVNQLRYYLGRPTDALHVVKSLALGVDRFDVVNFQKKIPIKLLGRIVLAVNDAGKAYYLNPRDRKVYYLGNPVSMLEVMKKVGVGAKGTDLNAILISKNSELPAKTSAPVVASSKFADMEKKIQELVNDEREKNGLKRLKWNDELATVARRHSQDQANENENLIDSKKLCSYPFIHHEGIEVGLYHSDRLAYYKVYYQSASAENIALIPESKESSYRAIGVSPKDCQVEVNNLNKSYEEEIKALKTDAEKLARVKLEIINRGNLTAGAPEIQIVENFNSTLEQIEKQAVTGWMNSPGHRRNILNGEYDEAGMGVAYVNGYYVITQVFIKRAECGYKGGVCCQKTGYFPFCYVPWSCDDSDVCR